jgi:hypothetical protein
MKQRFFCFIAFFVIILSSLACDPYWRLRKTVETIAEAMPTPTPEVSDQQDLSQDTISTDFTTKQAGTQRYNVSSKKVVSDLCPVSVPIQQRNFNFSDGQVELIFPNKTEIFYKTGENEYTYTYPHSYTVEWYEDGEVSSIEEIEYEAKRVIEFSGSGHIEYLYGPESRVECYWVFTLIE